MEHAAAAVSRAAWVVATIRVSDAVGPGAKPVAGRGGVVRVPLPEHALVSVDGKWRGQAFTDYGGVYGIEGPGRDPPSDSTQLLADGSLGILVFDEPVTPAQVEDGVSHTVTVGEALLRRISTREWGSGRNIFAHEASTPINVRSGLGNDIGSPHISGAAVVFGDAHVEFLAAGMDRTALTRLLTRAGDDAPEIAEDAP
jgi:hypothetical protein